MAKIEPGQLIQSLPFRMSYPSLLEPKEAYNNPAKKKFSVDAIFYEFSSAKDKETFERMMEAADAACVAKWGRRTPTFQKLLETGGKSPFSAGRHDCWFAPYKESVERQFGQNCVSLTLSSPEAFGRPPLYGPDMRRLDEEGFDLEGLQSEFYPGRWARASISAWAWTFKDDEGELLNGLSFGLRGIQLLHHDDTFGGRSRDDEDVRATFGVVDISNAPPTSVDDDEDVPF